jgi:hypothetical protein
VNAPVEVWAIVVMFGAVLGGLGIYSGGAGPNGRGLDQSLIHNTEPTRQKANSYYL